MTVVVVVVVVVVVAAVVVVCRQRLVVDADIRPDFCSGFGLGPHPEV